LAELVKGVGAAGLDRPELDDLVGLEVGLEDDRAAVGGEGERTEVRGGR
jgi:hypothetical protein